MTESTEGGDWLQSIALMKLIRQDPKLFDKLVDMKDRYSPKKRSFPDRPLMKDALVDGRLTKVPVHPIESILAEINEAFDDDTDAEPATI